MIYEENQLSLYKGVRNTVEWDGPRETIEGYGSFTAYEANIWKYLITTLANPPSSSAENLHNQHTFSSSSR